MIVAIWSPKAGAGSSTLAVALAAGAVYRGWAAHRILLVDAGAGAVLGGWAHASGTRARRLPRVVGWASRSISQGELSGLLRGFCLAVLDLRPEAEPTLRGFVQAGLVDRILVPCAPEGPDTWGLGGPGVRDLLTWSGTRVVPVRMPRARGRVTAWRRELAACGFQTLPGGLRYRLVYARALVEGSLPGLGTPAAREEVQRLHALATRESPRRPPAAPLAPWHGEPSTVLH